MGELIQFIPHDVNGVKVEQRVADGFINGTAMCKAYPGKEIKFWLQNRETLNFFIALSDRLGVKSYVGKLPDLDSVRLSAKEYADIFPHLIVSRRGSPENGGGTWVHPNTAVFLAQYCDTAFAVEVSFWVLEWFSTGKNPIQREIDVDKEYIAWQERYDIRIELKDTLRTELMGAVSAYAKINGLNPIKLCSRVHDTMNECIQGAKSRDIIAFNGLPLADLIRDYFDTKPLHIYAAINRIAINKILDSNIHPIEAVHHACDVYLGSRYVPKIVNKVENIHSLGRKLQQARKTKSLPTHTQLTLFPNDEAV